MRLLSDHDVYGATVRYIQNVGHDILTAAQLGLTQADDEELLRAAQADRRILLTRDRDFGSLIFVGHSGGGVIYLRMLPKFQDLVHAELARVLNL
jgi:predicted nuclease of predicted toxin-antitoxin system